MDEGEKEVQQYISLVTCRDAQPSAGYVDHSSRSRPRCNGADDGPPHLARVRKFLVFGDGKFFGFPLYFVDRTRAGGYAHHPVKGYTFISRSLHLL